MKKTALHRYLLLCMAVFCLLFTSCGQAEHTNLAGTGEPPASVTETPQNEGTSKPEVITTESPSENGKEIISIEEIPAYSGQPYVEIDGNQPKFPEKDKTKESFEQYSELDSLGRCGVAYANVGKDLMPTGKRESIGKVKPSGWHTVKYDIVEGKYLYNRCHLIGFQLTAENANEKNLITGTRYMNTKGMLPFENVVADYVEETGNHVLYRATPIFEGKNLVAKGVQMEGYSVEDEGDGICFNVFVYNVQPGIWIDYATGESREDGGNSGGGKDGKKTPAPDAGSQTGQDGADAKTEAVEIRGNKKSKIYHCPGQASYEEMADSDHLVVFRSEKEAQVAGYRKAKR